MGWDLHTKGILMVDINTTPEGGNLFGLNIYQIGELELELEAQGIIKPGTDLDSLSASDQEAMIINLLASNPMLLLQSNLFSNAGSKEAVELTLASIEGQKNQIISAMLTAWSQSVAEQAEESRKADIKHRIEQEGVKHDIKQRDIEKEQIYNDFIKWEQEQPVGKAGVIDAAVFSSYLGSLIQHQRHEELTATVNLAVDNYFDQAKPAPIEDNPISRSVLSAVFLQALVIAPAAQNLVLQPIEPASLSKQIAVDPLKDQAVFQPGAFPNNIQDQVLPAINFFVLDLVKDVMITLYAKQKETSKETPDKDFANTVANKVMGEVGNTDVVKERLIRQIPGMENASAQQLSDAATYAQLFSLVASLALFVKVDGGTMQSNDLKAMLLAEEEPKTDDDRSKVIGMINTILNGIPDPKVKATFVEATLKYLASMPDPSNFTDIMHALNAAAAEVNMGQRAVQTRRD
jgi:hypothetical protein